jgi:hypothetical protein
MPDHQIVSYALCIDDGGYPESLEVRKVYAVLADDRVDANNYIRVIDETGEDYLYPAKHFISIHIPPEYAEIISRSGSNYDRGEADRT